VANRAADEETEDGRIRNREASTKIRDAWIYKQIRSRQEEFTQYKQGRVFLGTWNVNAKGKADENIASWLCADWPQFGQPDIVVVGFQEMVDLNAVNVAVENKSATRSQFWIEKIRSTLNSRQYTQGDPGRAYTELASKFLVGLLVCVFVKAPHRPRVKYVHADSVGVGVMGMMGNKGGWRYDYNSMIRHYVSFVHTWPHIVRILPVGMLTLRMYIKRHRLKLDPRQSRR